MYCNGVYVTYAEDCESNEGGYWCQVYEDADHENEIDDFCIHSNELEINPSIEYWVELNTRIWNKEDNKMKVVENEAMRGTFTALISWVWNTAYTMDFREKLRLINEICSRNDAITEYDLDKQFVYYFDSYEWWITEPNNEGYFEDNECGCYYRVELGKDESTVYAVKVEVEEEVKKYKLVEYSVRRDEYAHVTLAIPMDADECDYYDKACEIADDNGDWEFEGYYYDNYEVTNCDEVESDITSTELREEYRGDYDELLEEEDL